MKVAHKSVKVARHNPEVAHETVKVARPQAKVAQELAFDAEPWWFSFTKICRTPAENNLK
jgi:hypothetical protein